MITFVCKLCGALHPAYEADPKTKVAKFPALSLTCERDSSQKFIARCRDGCPPAIWQTKVFIRGEFWCEQTLLNVGDPRCPKCGALSKRERHSQSLTWVVKESCDCHKKTKGATMPPSKLKLPEKIALLLESELP